MISFLTLASVLTVATGYRAEVPTAFPAPGPVPSLARIVGSVQCGVRLGAEVTCRRADVVADGLGPSRVVVDSSADTLSWMLQTSNASYDAADSIYRLDLALTNTRSNSLGTRDGVTSLGFKLFLQEDPVVTGWKAVPDSTAPTGLHGLDLTDALGGRADSEGYDDALLGVFQGFGTLLQPGVDAVEIRNGRPESPVVQVDRPGLAEVSHLHRSIPAPQRVRLASRLDAIRYSDRAFTLMLGSGRTVRGVLAEGAAEQLAPLFGRTAVASGIAQFRPTGALARVDADHLAVGTDRDEAVWGDLPQPMALPTEQRTVRKPQGPRTGLSALVGQWHDDTDDEEIFRLLQEMS